MSREVCKHNKRIESICPECFDEYEKQRDEREAQRLRMIKALELMLQADGEIHPGWNAEFLDALWIRKLAEYGLGYSMNNWGILSDDERNARRGNIGGKE